MSVYALTPICEEDMNTRFLSSVLSALVLALSSTSLHAQYCANDPVGECKDGCVAGWEDEYDYCSVHYSGNKTAQQQCYAQAHQHMLACFQNCQQMFGSIVAPDPAAQRRYAFFPRGDSPLAETASLGRVTEAGRSHAS
jgi:hypothetical protein